MRNNIREEINKFRDLNLLIESLKSDTMDVTLKKLDFFFQKNGFSKDTSYGVSKTELPTYSIITDKLFYKKELDQYENDPTYSKNQLKYGVDPKSKILYLKNKINELDYGVISIYTNYNNENLTKDLLNLIDSMGYFISVARLSTGKQVEDKRNIKNELLKEKKISIVIEPKFDKKIDFDDEYLYHTTNRENLEKIMKFGLIPKSKNTRTFYPERIYLSPNKDAMLKIKDQLVSDKGGEYINLRIKKPKNISLYTDPRFKAGFYTYDNISPENIEIF
jgi:hypothetical protein